jgi:hypothetical protein
MKTNVKDYSQGEMLPLVTKNPEVNYTSNAVGKGKGNFFEVQEC